IPHLKIRLEQIVSEIGIETEIICIDDGSGDQTPKLLSEWAEKSANVRVMIFSRNFGQQIALTAGLQHTKGDAIVILDADLQDPPELIPKMIKKYEEGFDMVYAQRSDRQGESAFKQATAFIFYRLMRIILGFNLPSDTGDFRLMSRRCLDAFLQMRENHRFLRGMFHWVGFEQAAVSFSRPKREFGTTKYTIRKMLSLSLNAAVSFSALPLRLILILGIAVSLFGMGYAGYSILRFFLVGDTVRGWTTLIVLITLLGGTTLVCLGIIGEYVSRIYDEIKCRPLYLLKETYNFSPRSSND
ncbi:MAG: glycosyltransferase family 2 protein, partial [Verrucomicrobiota bacterium]